MSQKFMFAKIYGLKVTSNQETVTINFSSVGNHGRDHIAIFFVTVGPCSPSARGHLETVSKLDSYNKKQNHSIS